jgi:hypothetical protein
MAKRKYSGKRMKMEPAVQTITLGIDAVTAFYPEGQPTLKTYFVDLSQIASVLNRRAYRQGINWAVAGIKVTAASGTSGDVRVSKLPNTWVLAEAWKKSMRAWLRMNREALEESPSVRPRFMDFKIYANKLHHQSGFPNNVPPLDANGTPYVLGEWEPSKIVYPDTTTAAGLTRDAELIAVGASFTGTGASGEQAVSIIEGYAASRGLPNRIDPNTPDDAKDASGSFPQNWMSAMFNEGVEQVSEILDDLISDNNIAPYPFEGDGTNTDTMYPGGANQAPTLELHDLSTISATTVGATTRLKGGNFPCGLMVIQMEGLSGNPLIQLDLVPGSHRGYMCEAMTEM